MKKELRCELRRILDSISPESIAQRSSHAANLLFQQPEYQRAEIMMIYLSLPHEADTTPIVLRAWEDLKRVLAPQVIWDSKQMIPIEIDSLEAVADTKFGIREPVRGMPIPVELIDLVIVPGLGFDSKGNRLGRGRGFYDRFLSRPGFKGVTCAFALEDQLVDSIPADVLDVGVQMLVTDQRVRRFDMALTAAK